MHGSVSQTVCTEKSSGHSVCLSQPDAHCALSSAFHFKGCGMVLSCCLCYTLVFLSFAKFVQPPPTL